MDTLLRDVLRYEDYRTAARAVVRAGERQRVSQELGSEYQITGETGRISSRDVQLEITLWIENDNPVLQTGVTVPIGQTVVLGTARGRGPGEATILTVRPTLTEDPGQRPRAQ